MPLQKEAPFLSLTPPPHTPGVCGSASVAQRPRGTNGHTQNSAQLCACAWLEGGRGGEWMVLWSGGGGEDGWFWRRRRKKKGRKERHTPRVKKKQMLQHNEKEETSAAAAAAQNKTFNSLFKLVS